MLGRHRGIVHYTIGQRRGIGIAAAEPLYVVAIDPRANRVIVGPREALATHHVELRNVNWLGDGDLGDLPAEGLEIGVRVRSSRPPVAARLSLRDDRVHVELPQGETGVAPGQACVFYAADERGTRVLGGGFIARPQRPAFATVGELAAQPLQA
jgi:tRNA-specific 2-thiouridylase